ncbi:MAG TPA: HAD family phosphatase [Terriglobales bacterium]|nr:HAD family phosphatase [Terriglobales bacterium]
MLQAIIFDMDGVIIDSHPVHRQAWQNFLLTLGKHVSEADLDCILEGWRREDILHHFLGDLTKSQVVEYGNRKDEFFQQVGVPIKLVSGLCEFLDHLQLLGIRKAVATSASEKRTRFTLDRLQLTRHFAAIVTAKDVLKGKPDPAIYYLAAEQMEVRPEHVVVIEDSVSGVKAAKSAGMKCLGIASNSRCEVLRRAGANNVIPDFVGLTLERLELLMMSSRCDHKPEGRSVLECD